MEDYTILEQEIDPTIHYLYATKGIQHTSHLLRTGDVDYACRVAEANLQICESQHWTFLVSHCQRILGDLDTDAGQYTSAHTHYDNALEIARSISVRDVLIEALLARGRWYARYMKDATSAFNDLNEALGYAVEGGYRIYEADIRVALAWAGIVDSGQGSVDREKAKMEAERALRMSEEMGYYWGKVDAEKVLKEISSHAKRPEVRIQK